MWMRTAVVGLAAGLLLLYLWNRPRELPKKRAAGANAANLEVATFAGGCFWCMEPPFDKLDGVVSTISGYTGGRVANPSYKQVSAGGTGHLEALQVTYDPKTVSYEKLLKVFWKNIDPTDGGGQFCDRGQQYESAIFVHSDEQREAAEKSKRELTSSGKLSKSIITPIRAAEKFYEAEEYHQDYYLKNPLRYRFYRYNCGRDAVLQKLWGEAK